MVGTSAATRVIYDAGRRHRRAPGLFLYRLDRAASARAVRSRTAATCTRGCSRRCTKPTPSTIAERPPAAHGLVFLPFLGGERSLGWDASRRGLITGLSFATTPLDIAQAALEGVCYRLAAVLDAIGGVESVVVTGGALLANPAWVQVLADVLGRPLEVSAVAEGSARGAALVALERLGAPAPAGADRPRRRAAGRPARDPSPRARQNNG